MDRDVLDTIEREIDQEVRARFPGTAVRQAVLLQYGDDPEIEPGDLWVRVLLDADGPEDNWEPALTAFEQANKTAIEQFTGYLATKLREIRLVEYTFSNNPVTYDGKGPRGDHARRAAAVGHPGVGARRSHLRAGRAGTGWPGNAGHADHGGNRGHARGGHPVGPGPHPRAASVPAAPDSEREARPRWTAMCWTRSSARLTRRCGHASPAPRYGRPCCCNTATTRKSSRGTCGSGCCSTRTGRRTTGATLTAFDQANKTAREQFTGYLAEKLREIRLVEYTFSNNPVTRDGHGPRASNPVGERLPDIQEWEHGEATPLAGPAGTGWPGNAGHADHGGNRGHARGGHPVGPGPHPRAASVPAAP